MNAFSEIGHSKDVAEADRSWHTPDARAICSDVLLGSRVDSGCDRFAQAMDGEQGGFPRLILLVFAGSRIRPTDTEKSSWTNGRHQNRSVGFARKKRSPSNCLPGETHAIFGIRSCQGFVRWTTSLKCPVWIMPCSCRPFEGSIPRADCLQGVHPLRSFNLDQARPRLLVDFEAFLTSCYPCHTSHSLVCPFLALLREVVVRTWMPLCRTVEPSSS